jgi:hypothetical protein
MNTSIAQRTTILVVTLLLLLIAGAAVRAVSADPTRPATTVEQPVAGGGSRMEARAT